MLTQYLSTQTDRLSSLSKQASCKHTMNAGAIGDGTFLSMALDCEARRKGLAMLLVACCVGMQDA